MDSFLFRHPVLVVPQNVIVFHPKLYFCPRASHQRRQCVSWTVLDVIYNKKAYD